MSQYVPVNVEDPRLAGLAGGGVVDDGGPGRATAVTIVAVAAGLMGIGAVMTFSAGATVDRPMLGLEFWKFSAFRQMVFVCGGLLALLLMSRVPYRIWFTSRGLMAKLLLFLALAMLALVYVPGLGVQVNGARRWVQLGTEGFGVRFQPSELLKLALPIFLAYWLARGVAVRSPGDKRGYIVDEGHSIRSFWRGFLPAVAVIGLCVAMVGIEDFGTAALLAAVAGAILLVSGARWLHLLAPAVPAILAFGYLLITKAHRIERIKTFLDIWSDPEGSGYQAIQSLCTIASGGWWGRGLGQGFVKGYLPEARNDFVFAVICEELGIIGASTVIVLLIVLMWKSRGVISRCLDPAGRLLAFGIALMIGLQAAMNIAVVTVSVPTKGISLPLVSAGGSGAIFLGALVGILASIARSKRPKESIVGAPAPGEN